MGKQYVLANHFDWSSLSLLCPSSHKPAPAWGFVRSIHFKLDACLTLCESLLQTAMEQQQEGPTTTTTATTPSLPDELTSLAEKIIACANSISSELRQRQSRPEWRRGLFTDGKHSPTYLT